MSWIWYTDSGQGTVLVSFTALVIETVKEHFLPKNIRLTDGENYEVSPQKS